MGIVMQRADRSPARHGHAAHEDQPLGTAGRQDGRRECARKGPTADSALPKRGPIWQTLPGPPVGRLHIHQSEIRDLAIIGFGDRGATAHVRTALGLDRHSTVCIVFDLGRRVRKSPSIPSRPTTIGSGRTWKGRQCRRSIVGSASGHAVCQWASDPNDGSADPLAGTRIAQSGIQDNSESPHRNECGPQPQTAQRLRRSGTTCDTYNPHMCRGRSQRLGRVRQTDTATCRDRYSLATGRRRIRRIRKSGDSCQARGRHRLCIPNWF